MQQHEWLLFLLSMVYLLKMTTARVTLTVNVMENAPADVILADLRRDVSVVSRYNSAVLSKLTFTFLSPKYNQLAFFSLDSRSGVLTLAKSIDRDAICPHAVECSIMLAVAVQPVQYFLVIGVTVRVTDINDNAPTFVKPQELFALSESTALGFTFLLPQARDSDSPKFGIVRYELRSDTNYFALNVRNASTTAVAGKPMELDLQLVESLDFEEVSFFRLLIVAYDGGSPAKTGNLLVEISVLDENDNSPKFDEPVYEISIVENRAYDYAVVNVQATDQDAGKNGLVTYAFSVSTEDLHSPHFQINRDSGNVYLVRPLDYERHSFFVLHIIARDQGEPAAASAVCKVVVHVTNVNDNPPVIAVNPHRVDDVITIEEELPVGSFVGHVSVTDADSQGGVAGVLACNFTADRGLTLHRMHGHEYKLVTSEVLDRENRSHADVIIECSDGGSPPMTSSAHLTVHLADVNDNAPQFLQEEYVLTVVENNPPHALIGRVEARDPDIGANGTVRYRLGDAHTHYSYTVDSVSGSLTAVSLMNRERHADDTLTIIAHDLAVPSSLQLTSSVKVTIKVIDADDNAPTFAYQHIHFSVDEGQPVGWRVGQVSAIDRDLAPHNAFYYVITSMTLIGGIGSMGGGNRFVTWPLPFDVDRSTGIIRTNQVLDRERQASYDFRVRAQSNRPPGVGGRAEEEGREAARDSVHVTVTVHDVNDNAPVFRLSREGGGGGARGAEGEGGGGRAEVETGEGNVFHVSYASPVGYIVDGASIHASDADIGRNADLTYAITSVRQVHLDLPITKVKGTRTIAQTSSLTLFNVSTVFVIETKSGLIVVNDSLLPYANTTFNVTVRVSDNGIPQLSASLFFYITINGSLEFEEPAAREEISPSKQNEKALLAVLDLSSFHVYATASIATFLLVVCLICCCCHSRQRRRNIAMGKTRYKKQQKMNGRHSKRESITTEDNESNGKHARNLSPLSSLYPLVDGCVRVTECCHSNGDTAAWQQQLQQKTIIAGQLDGSKDKLTLADKVMVDSACKPSLEEEWRGVRFTEQARPLAAMYHVISDGSHDIMEGSRACASLHNVTNKPDAPSSGTQHQQIKPVDWRESSSYYSVPYLEEDYSLHNTADVTMPHYVTMPKRHSAPPYCVTRRSSSYERSCGRLDEHDKAKNGDDDNIGLRHLGTTTCV